MTKLHARTSGEAQTTLPLKTLIDARHQLLRTFRSKKQGRSEFPGHRISQRRGQGLEFTDLRQYSAGDDIRHIDWNVTARNNEPYTRLYREEREHTTTVVVDLRPSMFSGSQCLSAVRAGKMAASILWHACESGDRCSAMVVSQRGQTVSRPLAGKRGALQACELIASEFRAACSHTDQQNPPLSPMLESINAASRSGGSYFVFSGFDTDTDPQWRQQLTITGATGRMVAVMLLDPLEVNGLPAGSYPYQSAGKTVGDAKVGEINRFNSTRFNDALQRSIDQQIKQFKESRVPLLIHNIDHNTGTALQALQQRGLL